MATIRENPIHAPPIAAEKPPTPQTFGAAPVKSLATRVKGPGYGYLGHFASPQNLMRGHNRGGHPRGQHPGFKAVQSKIAKEKGISKDRAGAILAASTRRASPAARRANPRLNRVK